MRRCRNRCTSDDRNTGSSYQLYYPGDCVKSSKRFLGDGIVDLIITDPPYGIEGDGLHKHYNREEGFVVDGYVEVPASEYSEFSERWVAEAARVLRPGGVMYLVTGWTHLREILNAVEKTDLDLINHLIWKYNFGVFTRMKYVTSHYHILYLVKPGAKPTFNTYARFSTSEKSPNGGSLLYQDMEDVWDIDAPWDDDTVWDIKREYKTGKVRNKNELPTALLEKMVQYSSNEGDLVCDFFAGSFSTARVAKAMNRNGVSFEISEEACEHGKRLVDATKWGSMLEDLLVGQDDRPKNQLKRWDEAELGRLSERYSALRGTGLTKKSAIDSLQVEFERGYFSILNALKRQGL